jgi:hypothetical protein
MSSNLSFGQTGMMSISPSNRMSHKESLAIQALTKPKISSTVLQKSALMLTTLLRAS